MEQAIYRMLTYSKNAAISTFKRLRRVKGLSCIVTKPQDDVLPYSQYQQDRRGSIFGMEDLVEYDEVEGYPEKLLIFNLFKEGYNGMNDYDTFDTDAFALTLYEEKLPISTIVEVNFYGRHMNFKVDEHRSLVPSVSEQLFIKNILVPAT